MATISSIKSVIRALNEGKESEERLSMLLNQLLESQIDENSFWEDILPSLEQDLSSAARIRELTHIVSSDDGVPTFLARADGQILAANESFIRLCGNLEVGLKGLGISKAQFYEFKHRIVHPDDSSLLKVTPANHQGMPAIFTGRAAFIEGDKLYILKAVTVHWDTSIKQSLKELFDLTNSELEILLLLAQGSSVDDIAAIRNTKLTTTRQQIKSILHKSGTNSQLQIATLATSVANTPIIDLGTPSSKQLPSKSAAIENAETYLLNCVKRGLVERNGRSIAWKRYGSEGGFPILLMHSTIFGIANFLEEAECAERNGFDILAVVRPGFGDTDFIEKTEIDSTVASDDCHHVLEALKFEPELIVSHDYGMVHALNFVKRHPRHQTKIVAISPIQNYRKGEDYSFLPSTQRFFFYLAINSSHLFKRLMAIGYIFTKSLGPKHWMQAVYSRNTLELDYFQNDETGQMISESAHRFNFTKNIHAQAYDILATVAPDLESLLDIENLELHMLAGQLNSNQPIDRIQDLIKDKPNIALTVIPDAGNNLAMTHTKTCHESIQSIAKLI